MEFERRQLISLAEVRSIDRFVHIEGMDDDIIPNGKNFYRVINYSMKHYFGNDKFYKFIKTNEYPDKYTHKSNRWYYHESWFKPNFDFDLVYPDLFDI